MGTFIITLLAGCCFGLLVGFKFGFARGIRWTAQRSQSNALPIIGRLALGFGGIALFIALVLSIYTWHFTHIAQRANGIIVEMVADAHSDSASIGYAPSYRFQDANGLQHTVTSHFYSSPPEFHVGDRVTVLYISNNPLAARIDTYWQVWGLSSLLGITGGMSLVIGFSLIFISKIIARFSYQASSAQTV